MMSADAFREFFTMAEPRLRRALVAAYGPRVGREATVDALSWAWQHRAELDEMDNAVGYLFRVGQTAARRQFRRGDREVLRSTPEPDGEMEFDSGFLTGMELSNALESLSIQQRTAVVLVHGHGIPLRVVAKTMEISVATVREHTRRGLNRLRAHMEVLDAH